MGKEKITESKLFSIYLHELWRLATEIEKNCEKIFEEAKIPEEGFMIQVSPELHSCIIYVLINAANIKKLVYTAPGKLKNETKKAFDLRLERGQVLQGLLNDLEISEMKNNKVRNTIEHFDEYLDNEVIRYKAVDNPNLPMAYNMTFSHWDVFNPRVYPIRLYIANERKFYNMGHSFNIGKIYDEALAILDKLNNTGIFKETDGPGGLLVI